ncbi:hypothetical protein GBA52_003592 [Prunus armeniaca]|nr:hypothetical protein GBA52_003592 [Prunus armeniaca]
MSLMPPERGLNRRGPSFVTQEDVITILEKELSQSQEDWKYLPQPRIHQAYFNSHILKATKHQALSFLTEGNGARRSTSTVSLMP